MDEASTILVIDDDPGVRELVGQALTHLGYRVLTAVDGEEGLACYAREKTDLVLLDLSMPGIQGEEVLERLLVDDPAVRVVVLTGFAAHHARMAGAREVLDKPFTLDRLVEMVRQNLAEPDPSAAA